MLRKIIGLSISVIKPIMFAFVIFTSRAIIVNVNFLRMTIAPGQYINQLSSHLQSAYFQKLMELNSDVPVKYHISSLIDTV